jgi:thiol-disulfide isomerase/thioredoxin
MMTIRIKQSVSSTLLATAIVAALTFAASRTAQAASDLTLAPNLSFTDDSSPNFPIAGKDLSDASMAGDRPTIIFFGTSNCWNTAREAERLVEIYPKYRDRVRFLVVDVNHASSAQQELAGQYYHNYIPTLAIFDKSGHVVYDRAGETAATRGDSANLRKLLDSALR